MAQNPDIAASTKFGDEAKQRFAKYKDQINNKLDNNIPEIVADLRTSIDLAEDNPQRTAFINDYFPPLVKALVARKFMDYAQHYRPLNGLFCHWICRRLDKLEAKLPGDAIVLRRLFSPRKLFYDSGGLPNAETTFRDFEADGREIAAGFRNKDSYFSDSAKEKAPAFVYNLNCFGRLGGFEKILKILTTTEVKATDLKYAKRLVKVVANMGEYMDKEQWNKHCLPIGQAALIYVGKMNEYELRQMKTGELSRLLKQLHRFFVPTKPVPKTPPSLNPVEEAELSVALRLSTFSSLERRLTGIGMLRGKMERLTQKWPEGKEANPETVAFAGWLRTNKFVEMLFGESIREEVLKRTGDMLAFMYAWGALTGPEIAELWDSAIFKHDAMQGSIFQVLELTALHLSKRDSDILFAKIRQMPLSSLKESMVGMLNTLARNEYYRSRKRDRKAKKIAEEAKAKAAEQKKLPVDPEEEEPLLPDVEETKDLGSQHKQHAQPTQAQENKKSQSQARHEQKMVDFKIPANLEVPPSHKRARDDSSQVGHGPEKQHHARTGSGDQTSLPYKRRTDGDFEKEPYVPEEEEGEELVADSCDVLNYIWSLTNEVAVRDGLSPGVQTLLIDLFLGLLSRCYRSKCIDYLHMCEGMLATDNSLNQFSRIYIKIADMLGQEPQWKLQPTVEDFLQKLIINLIKFKRIATQKGLELLNSERNEEEECMDTQSSIEEKNARENEPLEPVEDAKEPLHVAASPAVENLPPPRRIVEPGNGESHKDPVERLERRENAAPEAEDQDIHLTLITNDYMKLTYYQELEQRLELLKFLLTKGRLQLKAESIPLLWQTMLINSFSRKEVDAFFDFMFSVIRSENGLTLVAAHVFDSFFFEILLKMDQRDYPENAFKCLKEMIIALNISYKQMVVTAQGSYEVADIRLIGMEAVWEIALQSHEEAVRRAAKDFLHEIYKRLSQDLVLKQGDTVREEFILKCMSSVKLGMEGIDRESTNADYTARITRALELLSGYIDGFETTHADKKHHFIPDQDYDIYVNDNGGSKRQPMRVNSTTKTRELFENIYKKCKFKAKLDELLFIVQGRIVPASDLSLYDNGIKEGITINVSTAYKDESTQSGSYAAPARQELEITEESKQAEIAELKGIFPDQSTDIILAALRKAKGNTEQAASYLMDEYVLTDLAEEARGVENARLVRSVNTKTTKLSEMISGNDKYFSVLFQLLDSGIPAIADQAWALISKIPINPKLQNDILSIKSMEAVTPWDKIYSIESPFKLAYNLQIISGILHSSSEESRYEWITCFVLLEGFSELCNAVARFPARKVIEGHAAGTVSATYLHTFMQCVELSFRIIKELLEGSLIGLGSECYKEYRPAPVVAGAAAAGAATTEVQKPVGATSTPSKSQESTASNISAKPLQQTIAVGTEEDILRQVMGPDTAAFGPEALVVTPTVAGATGECAGCEQEKERKTEAGRKEPEQKREVPCAVLKDEVGQTVVAIIERQEVVKQIVNVLGSVNVDAVAKETATILKAGLEIIADILCSDLKGLALLYGFSGYKEYLHGALVRSSNENNKSLITSELTKLFGLFAKFGKKDWGLVPPDVFHLDLLVEMLPRPADNLQNTEIYFGFLAGLFDLYSHPELAPHIRTKPEFLVVGLLDSIKKRLQMECAEPQDDKQLAGYLRLLGKLIELREDSFGVFKQKVDFNIVEELCNEIYGTDAKTAAKQPRKCAMKATMTSAVQLLLVIAKKSPVACGQLLPRLAKFHEAQVKCPYKDTGVDVETKAPGSYVGLRNFGCTCYINSLLQQLFMMPDLRYKLLQMDTKQIAQTKCDNVTGNLQKIFAALLLSKQRYYPPTDFCRDFHETDGKSINVFVQQDVDEFFNRLTEKLDAELRALGQETVLKDTMEIVLLQEISSLETDCVYASQKEDPCLTLPLDIKGRKSIVEALDFFVKEEILEGDNKYHCERDERLIRASKKCVLKKVPQTLILNLKRFEFNFATMQKQKLNDYCEFPTELNIYKWTYDAFKGVNADSPSDYQYELVGVLVHSGTAEGGHYYSYIKEREETSLNAGKWFEFNDTRVQPFDPAELKNVAFGTQRRSGQGYSYGSGDANAYLLVYQKSGRLEVEDNSKGAKEKFGTLIEQESEALTNTRIYLDSEYSRFVKEFFKLWKPEAVDKFSPIDSDTFEIKKSRQQTQTTLNPSGPAVSIGEVPDEDEVILTPGNGALTMCKLAVLYANDLIVKTKALPQFKEWTGLLIPHIKANALFSVWLIKYMTKHKETLFEMLIECTDGEIREQFLTALTEATKVVARVEEPFMRQVEKFLIPSKDPNTKIEKAIPRSAIVRFAGLLLTKGFGFARSNYRRFNEFFSLLTSFAMLGTNETACMINESAIYLTIDFIANTANPLKPSEANITRPTMGEQFKEVDFRSPLILLSVLIRKCSTARMRLVGTYPKVALCGPETPTELPESEIEFLFSPRWSYLSLIPQGRDEMLAILVHLTWEDEARIKLVIPALLRYAIDKRLEKNYGLFLSVLKELLMTKDSYVKQRCFTCFYTEFYSRKNIYEYLDYYKDLHEQFVVDLLELIAEISSLEKLADMIRDDKAKLLWTPDWLAKILSRKLSDGIDQSLAEMQKKARFIARCFAEVLDLKREVVEPATMAPSPAESGAKKEPEKTDIGNAKCADAEKMNGAKNGAADVSMQN